MTSEVIGMPVDPMGMLRHVRDLVQACLDGDVRRWAVKALQAPVDTVKRHLVDVDRLPQWREQVREQDVVRLARCLSNLDSRAGQFAEQHCKRVRMREALEAALLELNWCLEGLGMETDFVVLVSAVKLTSIADVQRQLRIAERIAEVLKELVADSHHRLKLVRGAEPLVGTGQARHERADTLSRLEAGLETILHYVDPVSDNLSLYMSMLRKDLDQLSTPGYWRQLPEQQQVSVMHAHHRKCVDRAIGLLLPRLAEVLPPMPLDILRSEGHEN